MKNTDFEKAKEEVAIEMIKEGEPFDKIQLYTKISLDRVRQLAVDLKKQQKSISEMN